MDKTVLVGADFALGARILKILDQTNLKIRVAMWLRTSEYEDWRFVLASPLLDGAEPSEAYGLIYDALEQAGLPLEHPPSFNSHHE